MGPAAEAVVELLRGTHREGRRLLVVERAAGAEVGPRLLELHVAVDDIHDVGPREKRLDEVLRDHAGIIPPTALPSPSRRLSRCQPGPRASVSRCPSPCPCRPRT